MVMSDHTKKNLLAETVAELARDNKSPKDVFWVGDNSGASSWDEFALLAKDIDYDPGYGRDYINLELVIVGTDWWLERVEYDGSEWWAFKTMPTIPFSEQPLTAESIRS